MANNVVDEIEAVNEKYHESRNKAEEKIFKADSGFDNEGLKRVHQELLNQNERPLADKLHYAMYENRAVERVKQAERLRSSLGEWFNASAFADKIKAEGDMKEADVVMPKSTAFDGAPHFAVGMYFKDTGNPEQKDDYVKRVQQITKEMDYQVNIATNRVDGMNNVIEKVREKLGADVFDSLYQNKADVSLSEDATVKSDFSSRLKSLKGQMSGEAESPELQQRSGMKLK